MFEKINSGEEVVCSTFTSNDRQNKWKITITTVEYDNEGKPVECIGVISNISYQMHKEQKYKRKNQLLTSSASSLEGYVLQNCVYRYRQ